MAVSWVAGHKVAELQPTTPPKTQKVDKVTFL